MRAISSLYLLIKHKPRLTNSSLNFGINLSFYEHIKMEDFHDTVIQRLITILTLKQLIKKSLTFHKLHKNKSTFAF